MNRPSHSSVLILGAGAAGLSAARELACHGVSAIVLEARARLGGRIHTLRDASTGEVIELGAEFVHGYPPSTLRLLDEWGVGASEVPDRHRFWKNGRSREMPDFWDRVGPALTAPYGPGPDRSFAESLARTRMPRENKRLARSFIEGFHAADPVEMSQRALKQESEASEDIEADQALRLNDGYGALIARLASDSPARLCRILTRSPVRAVRWEKGQVEVEVGRGAALRRYTARATLLTLPPGPLRNLSFFPAIPEKQRALERLHCGEVIKLVLRFRERFWEKREGHGLSYLHSSQRIFPTWWTAAPLRSNTLTGWTGGPAARELSGLGVAEVQDQALASLARLFGTRRSRLAALVERADYHDWQSDPFSQGAYGYVKVGGIGAPQRLARPLKSTLFFAGEITEGGGLGGTVESALHSGQRAARQILAAFRR